MVKDIGVAEREAEERTGMGDCINKGTDVRDDYQLDADFLGHDEVIKQGVAYGYKTVICHCSQEAKLSISTERKKKKTEPCNQ